jgi:hypothetical protein
MRNELIVVSMLLCAAVPASAQVGFGSAHVSIGINVPIYPQLLRIPDYPVYYASELDSNYFFYDGLYWVYQDDYWYSSSWYDGPWDLIEPDYVPVFILRVPVRYYRRPPIYFGGWQRDAAPRWGQHWGNQWAQHRSGWDRWNHASVPAAAPLPTYQKQYRGDRYPRAPQQQALRDQNYRYQSRDPVVRQHNEAQPKQDAQRSGQPTTSQRSAPPAPRSEPGRDQQRPAPTQRQPDQSPANQNPSNHRLSNQRSADSPQPAIRQNNRQNSREERRPEQRQQPAPNTNQPGPAPQTQHGPPQPRSEPQPARDEGRKQNDDRGRDHDR